MWYVGGKIENAIETYAQTPIKRGAGKNATQNYPRKDMIRERYKTLMNMLDKKRER